VSKRHHFIRVNASLIEDAKVWSLCLQDFNGTCYFNDLNWTESSMLELYTDSSGNRYLGCGCFFKVIGHFSSGQVIGNPMSLRT
jgi:hypothetical protein